MLELGLAATLMMVLSPVVVGLGVAGPVSWVLMAGIPGVLLGCRGRPQAGLAAGVMLQALVLHRHGITAQLLLVGLWLVWLPQRRAQALAAAAFAAVALLGTRPWMGWLGAVAAIACLACSLWSRGR